MLFFFSIMNQLAIFPTFLVMSMLFVLCYSAGSTDWQCPCPRNYKPLCGSDGVEYGNNCTFQCAKQKNPGEWTAASYAPLIVLIESQIVKH